MSRTVFGIIFACKSPQRRTFAVEDLSHLNSSQPYGWMVYAIGLARFIGRVLGGSPQLRDERAATREYLDVGLNQPSGPR